MKKSIPYGRQYIDERDIKAVEEVLHSDYITQGSKVIEFEESLAKYCGAKYAVCFNSGTSALHASYFASGLSSKEEMITSPNTFVATANAALYLGAKPVFCDIEKENGNMDISLLPRVKSNNTKLIVPVHYSGNPLDMRLLSEISCQIPIIEDAAHALGAKYKNEKVGSCRYSEMAIFSFHPVKQITTGEGGAVLTNNEEYYEKMIMFRSHGITREKIQSISNGDWYYEMQFLGYNYRITDIQAALGLSQLKKIDKFIENRQKICNRYLEEFQDNSFFNMIKPSKEVKSAHHIFPILLKNKYLRKKSQIFQKLRNDGLGVQVHYIPVYMQPYYNNMGFNKGLCPNTEDFYSRELSIPIYPSLKDEDLDYVIKTIFKIFHEI